MNKKFILVLNCGSSSLKFSLVNTLNLEEQIFGFSDYLFSTNPMFTWTTKDSVKVKKKLNKNSGYKESLLFLINNILSDKEIKKIFAIGHRVVHGGEKVKKSVIINKEIIEIIKDSVQFAPLHNPASLASIAESLRLFPNLSERNVAVFDTAFHQTMPKESYLYAIPMNLYEKYKIRRYGAHGISHYYIVKKISEYLKKPIEKINIISCHLGNGGSITAIVNGKSIDTSMGLTPLEGIVMGTRSGDIDPSIIFYLYKTLGFNIEKIFRLLNSKSGILGLTKKSSDFRFLEKNFNYLNEAKIAMKIYCHRLAKYIASYFSLMNDHVDSIVFTGGIGENSCLMREITLKKLSLLNVYYNNERNFEIHSGRSGKITDDIGIPVFVIPSKESIIIAEETYRTVKSLDSNF
ncbi:acetate kinase [Candidatus Riesia sp. GBBU]|nr:acetate kinase [Candidatus Riesia sp. GBBU]